MKIGILTFLLCGHYMFCYPQTAPARYDSVIGRLGKEFANDTATASLSIGIRYRDQTWFYNFGKGNNTEHAVYEIGSITKTFTSLVLANAVNEGKLSLNDDVRNYLDGSFPALEYNGAPVRLLHLANTSSALPDNLFPRPDTGYTKQDFFKALTAVKPDTIPGTKTHHSNTAAALLAFVLEKVYNESIDLLIKRYILDPLHMVNTSFGNGPRPAGLMTGYNAAGKPTAYLSGQLSTGTGGMRSSSSDMIKYLSYLQTQADAVSRMALTPTISIDAATNKVRDSFPIELVNDRVYAISLNWLQYHPAKGDLRIWTDGGTFGFRSYIVLYPEKELSLIFLSNRTGENMLDKMYRIGSKIAGITNMEK